MAGGREKRPRSPRPESSSPGKKPSQTALRTRQSRHRSEGTSGPEKVTKVQHTPSPYSQEQFKLLLEQLAAQLVNILSPEFSVLSFFAFSLSIAYT